MCWKEMQYQLPSNIWGKENIIYRLMTFVIQWGLKSEKQQHQFEKVEGEGEINERQGTQDESLVN